MKAFFSSIIFFAFFVPCVFSLPLETLVSAAHAAQLRASSGELITETQLRNPVPGLLPNNNELLEFVTVTRNALNPSIMVEALFLYEKPGNFHTPSGSWDEKQKTGVFNQIIALSTLTGTQYFSASRNAMRTFYEYSSIIDGPQTRNPLPDPVYTQLPETLTLFAMQKDLTFGNNVYRYYYVNSNNIIFFAQENVTSLSYGIIPAIGRNNLHSVVSLIDCGDSILIYVISMARAASLPGLGDRISNSFNNRAQAILKWLTGRLDSELFIQDQM
jgi:hypothetical protein